jgi:hypothetical protein
MSNIMSEWCRMSELVAGQLGKVIVDNCTIAALLAFLDAPRGPSTREQTSRVDGALRT